jgi:hypothetical protein
VNAGRYKVISRRRCSKERYNRSKFKTAFIKYTVHLTNYNKPTAMENNKPETRKIIRFATIFISCIIIIKFASHYIGKDSSSKPITTSAKNNDVDTSTMYGMLKDRSDTLNAACPRWVNNVTELLSTGVSKPKSFLYNFLIKKDSADMNISTLKDSVNKSLLDFVASEDFKPFRDSSVTMIYNFCDVKNKFLFQLVYSPDVYNASSKPASIVLRPDQLHLPK